MSTPSTADDACPQTTTSSPSPPFVHTPKSLFYAVNHVFLPVDPPNESDDTPQNNLSLVHTVCAAAHTYGTYISDTSQQDQWRRITKMLYNLAACVQSEYSDTDCVVSQLRRMETGDVLAYFVPSRNAAILLTKQANSMLCEAFPVSAVPKDERGSVSVICSYPGSSVDMPTDVFHNGEFARFLSRPSPNDPHFVNVLLDNVLRRISAVPPPSWTTQVYGTLRGIGHAVHVPHITKHVRDHISGTDRHSWRRSRLWLVIRVAIQMAVNGRSSYKSFMLFFICTLSADKSNTNLSRHLLHLMSHKILRRLNKLGSSPPNWLSGMALDIYTSLREILDTRWKQLCVRGSPFQNPSQNELIRDTQLSLLNSREYIRKALGNHGHEPLPTPFRPKHPSRGTIQDFFDSESFGAFFYDGADPGAALYDVERLVEECIDDWVASVRNVDGACVWLAHLLQNYTARVVDLVDKSRDSQRASICILTVIEFHMALDKLVLKEVPLLADYPPIVQIDSKNLFLRKKTSLDRLARAVQYFSARHSQSRWELSVLSDEFTEYSFPVRYYDQSPHLHQLKARIDEDSELDPSLQHASRQRALALPASPLHAKVVVFELQCPACIGVWRSAAHVSGLTLNTPALTVPKLTSTLHFSSRGYHVVSETWRTYRQCQSYHERNVVDLVYPRQPSQTQDAPEAVCYHVHLPSHTPRSANPRTTYTFRHHCSSCEVLEQYAHSTCHTSNNVLAAQADCPADLSHAEFVAFGQLRSGGSLQWLNILRGLRTRTLNLRHHHVYFLLLHAISQVGPFNFHTGTWIWHQELQDASFCVALLDELEGLLMEVGVSSDSVLMNSISLLLTRVFVSSPREDVSARAIALLRNVRRKAFACVQDLSYDLEMTPGNEERRGILLEMAATCRSTFDVDNDTLHQLICSPENVDILLSCSFFIRALSEKDITDAYLWLILDRDHSLSLALEETLRNTILDDASDCGIDLAVSRIFTSYRPGTCRWKQLQSPNNRWLTNETKGTEDQRSRIMHINLLNGELRVAGQPLDSLPDKIRNSEEFNRIFRDQGFLTLPSSLAGMDFMTLTVTSNHKMHFSLRDDLLVVQIECDQINGPLVLIPWTKLEGDLPPALLYGHVHWLNPSSNFIEIRPLHQLWEESSEHWRIDLASGSCRIYKGRETLVDVRSPTWAMFSKCFECLDAGHSIRNELSDLIISTSPTESSSELRLSVTLPRYTLSFFVNERGELESCDLKNMVYDENQSVGTLIGLGNLLVLRPKTRLSGSLPDDLFPRRVLVPNIIVPHDENQTDFISIDTGRWPQGDSALYHTYDVDTELGYLVGNDSLSSTQFLACLHALTSWHRPDPLTEKTGAQAALSLLQSAACRSIMKLKALDYNDHWTQYPHLNAAYQEIRSRYYWRRNRHNSRQDSAATIRRAAYLFPSNAAGLATPRDCNSRHSASLTAIAHSGPGLPSNTPSNTRSSLQYLFNSDSPTQIELDHLMYNRQAPRLAARVHLLRESGTTPSDDVSAVDKLLSHLCTNKSFQEKYFSRLDSSVQYVGRESRKTYQVAGKNSIETLMNHYNKCRCAYSDSLETLKKCLCPTTDPYEQAHFQYGQWPPITADVLLRYLSSTSPVDISRDWKKCLTSLAILLLGVQRARRLLQFALEGLEEDLAKELEHEGCEGWCPEEYPDWLLIQIQGNFLIRRSQANAAMEIMSPRTGQNTIIQVNMGEGKSSVIIPIAAAALADGKQLVRVVVPKALTVQMFELLVARLGSLTNRPIYHLPFSRNHKYGSDRNSDSDPDSHLQIDDIRKLMCQCMAERGILLVQPEHVVSFKLMSVEAQLHELVPTVSHETGGASKWLSLQEWIASHVRDILDESDEILHPRFQLIYTFGPHQHLDGYPERWTITQQVLQLAQKHLYSLSKHAVDSVQYECSQPGSFPHIRILQASGVGQRLISSITEDVMAGELRGFNIAQHFSASLHDAISSFISDKDVHRIPDTVKRVEEYAKQSERSYLWSGLLLLRGLLTTDVLLFALSERRWRVDYGLVLDSQLQFQGHDSTMLAVPYRAKDVPAPNTQFGHPDLTIILTCLSYYYDGLSEEQLRTSFAILLDQDDPFTEYAIWVEPYDRNSLPVTLRNPSQLALYPSEQWDKVIFPLFYRNQAVVNFYLSRVVFPKEAKECTWKIPGSSWDLAEEREKLVTGFSGTNDIQWLLPLSITQRDFNHQKGTNARALACLLRPENELYLMAHENGKRLTTLAFLRLVTTQRPDIRILLDVGAQILHLSNRQVAQAWLDITDRAAAAVYFDENDELMILTRNGHIQPISSSSQKIEQCVVYLDHAHTRGTDIKFPVGSRAAVTLGSKVTKDALVQGCMRMRKLGHGHSVMFFAPPAVDRSIRAAVSKMDPNIPVTTVDILCWAIHETWADIQQRAPYWAQQGMNHRSRYDAWSSFVDDEITREQLSDAWLQPDLKSLSHLYAPRATTDTSGDSDLLVLDSDIRQRCKDLGILSLPSAQMDEEQEREVHREREREREVELPPRADAEKHILDPDVVEFVKTGIIPPLDSDSAFRPAFGTLRGISGIEAEDSEADTWSSHLLATADFCKTIKPQSTQGTIDQYLRPVQWILSSERGSNKVLVLLSPFEVDQLMLEIRASNHVHLHLYTPRTSQRMKPSDDLQLYSIPALPSNWTPPWDLIDQLNVFSGQLYLRDYEAYIRLCRLIGIPAPSKLRSNLAVRRSRPHTRPNLEKKQTTSSRPGLTLDMVKALLCIRNRGLPSAHTHMGRILLRQVLTESDFQVELSPQTNISDSEL